MSDNTFKAIVVEEKNKGLFKQSIKNRSIDFILVWFNLFL